MEGYHQYSGGCKYGGGLSSSTVEGYHSVQWWVRSTVEALNTRYTKHEMKSYKIYHDKKP